MSPHRRVAKGAKTTWTRVNEWLRYHPLPAYILVVLAATWAIGSAYEAGSDGEEAGKQARAALERSERERSARVKISGEIQRYVCGENNKQDLILAGLIEVSLGGQSQFGQGIDREALTAFDLDVLDAIVAIQRQASAAQGQAFQSAFLRALAQLRQKTPCNALVLAFTEASDTRDYKAIQSFLEALDRKDQAAADKAAPDPRK